jgi:hypothetical protein
VTLRDPRLAGTGGVRLLGILKNAFPNSGDAMSKGSFAGLPRGIVQSGSPWDEWYAVVVWADTEGRLQVLIDTLLEELQSRSRTFYEQLKLWNESRGVTSIAAVTPEIFRALELIGSSPDPTGVEDQILLLSQVLAELVRVLADPRAPEIGFGGMADSTRSARRARDAARQASAAVDAFLFEVQSASSFLNETITASDRDRTDRLMSRGVLVRHLLGQRVVVDASVSALLETLLAVFPTALDVKAVPGR